MKAIPYISNLMVLLVLTTIKPAFCQDTTRLGKISEEIEVIRPYKPILADAVKIKLSPDLNDPRPFNPNLSYHISDKKLERNDGIGQLKQQEPKLQANSPRNNLIKVGAGQYSTGLGEIYLNQSINEKWSTGLFFKHLNQKGNINSQKFNRQDGGIFIQNMNEKHTFNSDVNFNRYASYFYAFDPVNISNNTNPAKQQYQNLSFKAEISKNYQEDDEDFRYALKADAYLWRNFYKGRENSASLSGVLSKKWSLFDLGINTHVDLTRTDDIAYKLNNHSLHINPYFTYRDKNYRLTLGFNFIQQFGSQKNTYLLPAVSAEVGIVPDYLTAFAGFTGDQLKTTFLNLYQENPYLSSNIPINNAIERLNIYGGVKGNAGTGLGYKASIGYKNIENMPFYITDSQDINKFTMIYDNVKQFHLNGEVNVNLAENFTWTGKAELNSYKTTKEKEAWYMPNAHLSSNIKVSIKKQFIIDGEVFINGRTQAKTYNSTLNTQEQIVSVKGFTDLNLGVEYRFKQKTGAFLRCNNILGRQYQKYVYYPNLGFQIFGGLNYSF